jgi:hypothetical protein
MPGFSKTEPPRHAEAMEKAADVVGMHPQYAEEVLHVLPGLQ